MQNNNQKKKKEQKKIHLTKAGIFQTISDVLSISYLWENLHSRNICRLLTLNRFDCLRSQNKYILFQNWFKIVNLKLYILSAFLQNKLSVVENQRSRARVCIFSPEFYIVCRTVYWICLEYADFVSCNYKRNIWRGARKLDW